MKKSQNIINKLIPIGFALIIIAIWQIICSSGAVPSYMLPSPVEVVRAFFGDFTLLMKHAGYTLAEAFIGLFIGIALGFVVSLTMDRFNFFYRGFHPLMVIVQTIPTIAIAPLLVLWLGYDMAPKIVLVAITTFFPIAVGMLDGYRSVDKDEIDLMRSMGAKHLEIYRYVKLPSAATGFFSGLKISVTYSIVSAVIAEWLGGVSGLGVYMIRVKKAYAFDKMFAAIFLVSLVSIFLMWGVNILSKYAFRYQRKNN